MKQLNIKKPLFLADFALATPETIRKSLATTFQIEEESLSQFQVLVAYCSEGFWGFDSSAWVLLQNRETGEYFEVHGSHCSCYGFEDQWRPEATTLEYLQSENFGFSCGGYDDEAEKNKTAVREFLKSL